MRLERSEWQYMCYVEVKDGNCNCNCACKLNFVNESEANI